MTNLIAYALIASDIISVIPSIFMGGYLLAHATGVVTDVTVQSPPNTWRRRIQGIIYGVALITSSLHHGMEGVKNMTSGVTDNMHKVEEMKSGW